MGSSGMPTESQGVKGLGLQGPRRSMGRPTESQGVKGQDYRVPVGQGVGLRTTGSQGVKGKAYRVKGVVQEVNVDLKMELMYRPSFAFAS